MKQTQGRHPAPLVVAPGSVGVGFSLGREGGERHIQVCADSWGTWDGRRAKTQPESVGCCCWGQGGNLCRHRHFVPSPEWLRQGRERLERDRLYGVFQMKNTGYLFSPGAEVSWSYGKQMMAGAGPGSDRSPIVGRRDPPERCRERGDRKSVV